jgi:hypothetical protein
MPPLYQCLLLLRLRFSSSSSYRTSNRIRCITSPSKAISNLYNTRSSSSTRDMATKEEVAGHRRQEDRLRHTRGLLRRGVKGRHHLIRAEDQDKDQDQDQDRDQDRCRHPSVLLRTDSTVLGLVRVQGPGVLLFVLVAAVAEEVRHQWAIRQEEEWEVEQEDPRLLLPVDRQEDHQDHQEAAETLPSSFPTYPETFVHPTSIGTYRPYVHHRNHSHQRCVRRGARSTKRVGQG